MSQPKQFFEALFGGKPNELYVLLWTLPDKESFWFRDVDSAAKHAETMQAHNLYVGLGLANQDYGPNRRCPSDQVSGIVGICADIDLRSKAHPKVTLPSTVEDALFMLPQEFPPTVVVLTGNGAHIWWLFREPWIFESENERCEAAALLGRWHTLLRDNASQKGWTYERLADLARVLRIPGTINRKDPSNPKSVTIQSLGDRRYNPSEFADYLNDLAIPDPEAETRVARDWAERTQDNPLEINLSARIPEDRLNEWLNSDQRFKGTWFRQRHDLKDQSQSGYDLALACFGFSAGCSEQEIIDLIIHHRFTHKEKARTRLDYFARTLARAASASGNRPQGLPPFRLEMKRVDAGADPARVKVDLCHKLSAALGIEILRIVKLTGKEPIYRIELAEGKIEFPNVAKFISQQAIRAAIAAAHGKLIARIRAREWDQIAQMLLSACVEEDGGEELDYEGSARIYVRQYLAENPFIASIADEFPQNQKKPLVRDGRITICALDLQMHINKTTMQTLPVRHVAAMLSAIRAKSIRVRGTKFAEQSRWELPLGEFDPAEYTTDEPWTER